MTMGIYLALAASVFSALAKTTVVVVDAETLSPLSGVEVTGYLSKRLGWQSWKATPKNAKTTSFTDIEGRCQLSGMTNCGRMGCWIEHPPTGYYRPRSGVEVNFQGRDATGAWQPDNLVSTIRLDRVENPIPLFVNSVRLRLPEASDDSQKLTNVVLRYDLLVGDWLPPYGKGLQSDLILSSRLELGAEDENGAKDGSYVLINRVEWVGDENGAYVWTPEPSRGMRIRQFEESSLHPWQRVWELNRGVTCKRTDKDCDYSRFDAYDVNRCAAFRIRTKRDEQGRLVQAWYGKVYGDIRFEGNDARGLTAISMLYYLNPQCLDPNLEWDCRNNSGPVRPLNPEP